MKEWLTVYISHESAVLTLKSRADNDDSPSVLGHVSYSR